MQEIDKIIRAWKDDEYRMSLSAEERDALPKNPAGLVEFSGTDMNHANCSFGGPRSNLMILGYCL